MDPQIEQLKELVRQNTALIQETNQMVKSMRNASRWGWVMKFIWIGIIIFTSVSAYFYLQPYLAQILDFYGNLQSLQEKANNFLGGGSNDPQTR